jgi:hypothetical protein
MHEENHFTAVPPECARSRERSMLPAPLLFGRLRELILLPEGDTTSSMLQFWVGSGNRFPVPNGRLNSSLVLIG